MLALQAMPFAQSNSRGADTAKIKSPEVILVSSVESFRDAESEIVAATHIRVAEKCSIAEHTVGAIALLVGRSIGGGMGKIQLVTVLDPLENISVCIEESERVCRK